MESHVAPPSLSGLVVRRGRRGSTAADYGLLIAGIALVALAAIMALGRVAGHGTSPGCGNLGSHIHSSLEESGHDTDEGPQCED